jgi:prepilin-type N-terminal cleavage/methylation domain-containing protein
MRRDDEVREMMKRVSGQPRSSAGFTLPEVLAALALVGILLPVAMRGATTALSAAGHARHTTQAALLGEMMLNELVASGQWTASGISGDFAPDWPQYRWTCQTYGRDFGTSEVVVEVSWDERGRERVLRFSTLASSSDTGVLP